MYQYLGEINLYDFIGTLSVVAILIFNLLRIKEKKKFMSGLSFRFCNQIVDKDRNKHLDIFRNPTFCTVLEIIIFTAIYNVLCVRFNWILGDTLDTGANYFGLALFGPIVMVLVSLIVRINPLKVLDFFSVGLGLALFFAKIACFTWGCCAGIETEKFGMYNANYEKVMFPVQLVEAFLALAIFFFMLFYRKKASTGKIFPVYFMLFSSTRFFSEFLRMEPAVFMGLKLYQILCIIGFLVGLTQYLIVRSYGEKLNSFFDEKFKYELKKREKIVHAKK